MRLNFKGNGFTTKSGRALCETCTHCHTAKGEKLDQSISICNFSRPFPITFPIHDCTEYEERGRMSLPKMYQEAWELAQDKRTGTIGFFSKEDMRKREDRLTRIGRDIDPYEEQIPG